MAGLWGCIHVEEADICCKEMRACIRKRDNSGIIILEENVVQIDLIASEMLLFMKYDLVLHVQGQLM